MLNRIPIKVIKICDHWPADPPGLHFEPPRLHFERPWLQFEPKAPEFRLKCWSGFSFSLLCGIRIRIQLPKTMIQIQNPVSWVGTRFVNLISFPCCIPTHFIFVSCTPLPTLSICGRWNSHIVQLKPSISPILASSTFSVFQSLR